MDTVNVKSGDVTQSTLACDFIAELLRHRYGLEAFAVRLWHKGWNDTYRVTNGAGEATHFVRVGSINKYWLKNVRDVQVELELLRFLRGHATAVAEPVAASDGNDVLMAEAPEGARPVTVFLAVQGGPLVTVDPLMAKVAGSALAALHEAMGSFPPRFERQHQWDLTTLVADSVPVLRDAIGERVVLNEVLDLVDHVAADYKRCQAHLKRGLIHGDAHPNNWVFDAKLARGILVDFDHYGQGPLAYDIASFLVGVKPDAQRAFLQSYRQKGGLIPAPDVLATLQRARKIWLRSEILRLGWIWGYDWSAHADWSAWMADIVGVPTQY